MGANLNANLTNEIIEWNKDENFSLKELVELGEIFDRNEALPIAQKTKAKLITVLIKLLEEKKGRTEKLETSKYNLDKLKNELENLEKNLKKQKLENKLKKIKQLKIEIEKIKQLKIEIENKENTLKSLNLKLEKLNNINEVNKKYDKKLETLNKNPKLKKFYDTFTNILGYTRKTDDFTNDMNNYYKTFIKGKEGLWKEFDSKKHDWCGVSMGYIHNKAKYSQENIKTPISAIFWIGIKKFQSAHVGMYYGKNKIISGNDRRKVKIANIDKKHFIGWIMPESVGDINKVNTNIDDIPIGAIVVQTRKKQGENKASFDTRTENLRKKLKNN